MAQHVIVLPRSGRVYCRHCGNSEGRPGKSLSLGSYIHQLEEFEAEHRGCVHPKDKESLKW